jgi:O-antigen ligase
VITLFIAGCLSLAIIAHLGDILKSLGKNAELSGRLPVWQNLVALGMPNAWIGRGYGGFWNGSGATELWAMSPGWDAPHGHNGFLDLWLDLGYVGLIIFSISFVITFWKSVQLIRSKRTIWSLWPSIYLSTFFLINLTQSLIVRLTTPNFHPYWLLYVMVSCSLFVPQKQAKTTTLDYFQNTYLNRKYISRKVF